MKKIILAFALLLSLSSAFSQRFMHGVGITALVSTASGGGTSIGEGFTYSARFNVIETEQLAVAIGIPLSVGVSSNVYTSYNSSVYGNDVTSIGLVLNVPVILSLNMGRGSTKANRKKFGYFVGAGFGYHHGDFITDSYAYTNGTYSSNDFGPAANGGVRFGVGRKHRNIEVRLSYMKGLNDTKPNVFALAGLFNF